MFRPLVISAIGIVAMSVPSLAEPVPSNDELFRMLKEQQQTLKAQQQTLKEQQQTIKELRSELKTTRSQPAAAPAPSHVPDNARTAMAAVPMGTRAAPYNPGWTGSYIGIGGGGAWGKSDQSDSMGTVGPAGPLGPQGPQGPPGPPGPIEFFGIADGNYSVSGWLIGATVGHNEQIGRMVFGLEGDLSYARIEGSSDVCGVTPHTCGTTLKSLGTVRTRMGPTWGAWFPYLTGGLAFGEIGAFDDLFAVSGSKWRIGWTFGGGLEVMLAPSWSFKVEYLHVDLGREILFDIVPGVPEKVSLTTEVVRAGLNYRFNWDDPSVAGKGSVVAKY